MLALSPHWLLFILCSSCLFISAEVQLKSSLLTFHFGTVSHRVGEMWEERYRDKYLHFVSELFVDIDAVRQKSLSKYASFHKLKNVFPLLDKLQVYELTS